MPKPSSIGGVGSTERFTGSRAACYALVRNAAIPPHLPRRSANFLRLQRMAVLVVDGAVLTCSFGSAPSALSASPASPAGSTNAGAATIMDFLRSRTSGRLASAAAPQIRRSSRQHARRGFHPEACIPATASPWAPGSPAVTIGGLPALDSACTSTACGRASSRSSARASRPRKCDRRSVSRAVQEWACGTVAHLETALTALLTKWSY